MPKDKGFCKTGAYDCVYDIEAYCKGKRKTRLVILHQSLLPIACAKCGKLITDESDNRTIINPKSKEVTPMHYACSWEALLEEIYSYRLEGDRLVKY